MKRLFFIILIIAVVSIPAQAKYSGGSGTAEDPYQIGSTTDLLTLAADTNDYDKHFILTADIDLAPNLPGNQIFTTAVIARDVNNANYFYDGIAFAGVFNGAGHKIINLTIDANGTKNSYLGLFGYINTAEIKALGLQDINISGVSLLDPPLSLYIGGLVGESENSSISNCYSTGKISSGSAQSLSGIGGLVGNNDGDINNCYSTCNVSGYFNIGGLVGGNSYDGIISNSYATGYVTTGDISTFLLIGGLVGENDGDINNCNATGIVTSGNSSLLVGGLVGQNGYGSISNCYSAGAVIVGDNSLEIGGLVGGNHEGSINSCYSTGDVEGGYNSGQLGGLVGDSYEVGTISKCYAAGNVTGGDESYSLGGLVGENDGDINNCYAIGTVTGGDDSWALGGLVGWNWSDINNCYAIGNVTGGDESDELGGLVGLGYNLSNISDSYFLITSGPDNGYGEPLTDKQMKQQASFIGWDFVWEIVNGPNDIWSICEGVHYPKLAWQYIVGDYDNDKDVDFTDFALMGLKWLQSDSNLYCGGKDLTGDGRVDLNDLSILCNYWLEGL